MKRRNFIKTTALGSALPFWLQGCDFSFGSTDFPIFVHSDHQVGHLMMESQKWPSILKDPLDIAIVGGGVAGLAAANKIKTKSWQLFELSDRL